MLITGGKIFYNDDFIEKDILIEEGKIKKIGTLEKSDLEKTDETINAGGLLILPGLIDVHTHLRDPGETYKEDFFTGTKAAVAGGITTLMDMPNNIKPIISVARLNEKKILAAKKAICDVFFHFGCSNENFEEIKKANPNSLKLYLFKSTRTEEIHISNYNVISKHFESFDKQKPIVVHAEGKDVEHVCTLSKKQERKLHLAHASTNKEITSAKINKVSVEVTPNHLFLSNKDIKKLGKLSKVYPSLKEEKDRAGLWQVLDKIDCIATDHAPHTIEDKVNGAAGMPGLETSFALMCDAYNKKLINMNDLVNKMSITPASLFGLKNIGKIKTGYFANIIFVDTRKEWVVKGEELETKCKWSPFEGKKLKGKVMKTIHKGNLIYEDGEFL